MSLPEFDPTDISLETIRKIVANLQHQLTSNVHKALELGELAVAISLKLNDPYARAYALRSKAAALANVDERLRSLEYFDEALRGFEAANDEFEATRTRMNRISVLSNLSRFDEALSDAELVTGTLRRLGREDKLGRHLLNVSNIHFRLDQFRQALAILDQAEPIIKRLGDQTSLSALYGNRAVFLTSLNEAPEALKNYQLARKLAIALDMPRYVAECDYNVCYLHFLQGRYTKALGLLQTVRPQIRESGDRFHLALCDRDEGEIYLALNLYEDSIRLANQAYAAFEPLGLIYDMAKSLVIKGVAEHRLGHFDVALKLFGEARAIYGRDKNVIWLSRIDCFQAAVYLEKGNYAEGLALTLSADAVFSQSGLNSNTIFARLLTATFRLELGDLEGASAQIHSALTIKDETCSPWVAHQLLYVFGRIQRKRGDIEEARASFRKAIEELECMRSNINADYLRMVFLIDKIDTYQALVRLDLEIAQPESLRECFETIERAKSRTLLDLIFAGSQDVVAPSEPQEKTVGRIKTLRKEWNWFQSRIRQEEEKQSGVVSELMKEAREREEQLVRLQRELPPDAMGHAALGQVTTASLEEIQMTLPEETALIEFYTVDGNIMAFCLTRSSFEVTPVLADSAFVKRIFDLFRFQISRATFGAASGDGGSVVAAGIADRHLHRLYEKLVAPLEDSLSGVRSLVFVPHDFLHYVPFHALFDGQRHLIERFEISVAPSATVFRACVADHSPTNGVPLVCGIRDARNPHMSLEVEVIGDMFADARVYLDSNATLERLKTGAQDASLIHIASHGSFREDNPMFSSIQLGDSQLSLFDVYSLKTSAKLVTLSGCGTGMNAVIAGDELLGLVRGFLYAGARSLLVSLWNVNDRATSELMRLFYSQVAAGDRFASGLRTAMLSLKELYPHPYYWAPFTLIGDPGAALSAASTSRLSRSS